MERIVERREAINPYPFSRKRTAAYARVSSDKASMAESLAAQVSYYSAHMRKNPLWEYIGVYADEARTGTKDERPEFQRLLADCRAGKIDLILTKSISRFARNTLTVLETVRELKEIGVDVYFERENLHSLSADGELMLTILASFAQEESRSVSENCKWRYVKQFEKGIQPLNLQKFYGYRRNENGDFVIYPDEFSVVQYIFKSYLDGQGMKKIANTLNGQGIPSPSGGSWNIRGLNYMLGNEKYKGDLLLQKYFVADHLTKRKHRNHGELPAYYVEGNHPAAVSGDDFQMAQEYKQKRAEKYRTKSPRVKYPFTGKIRCASCGKNYSRKVSHGASDYRRVFWNCSTYLTQGKSACPSKQIPEEELERMAAQVCDVETFDAEIFKEKVQRILIPAWNQAVFVMTDGREIKMAWEDKSRRWTDEMKAKNYERLRRGRKTK